MFSPSGPPSPARVAPSFKSKGCPQEEQNLPEGDTLAPQEEQNMGRRDSIIPPSREVKNRPLVLGA
jgi:hypothetical protein